MSALLARLKDSIAAGSFDSETANAFVDQPELGASALDRLQHITTTLIQQGSAAQVAAAINYLTRLSCYLSEEKLPSWLPFILHALERSHEVVIEKPLQALCQELAPRYKMFTDVFLERFVSSMGTSRPIEQSIVLLCQHHRSKDFFSKVADILAISDKPTLMRAVELLVMVAHKQGPNLHEFAETPALTAMLKIMEETEDSVLLVVCTLGLIIFLPSILASMPKVLPRLLHGVVRRMILWNDTGSPPPILTASYSKGSSSPPPKLTDSGEASNTIDQGRLTNGKPMPDETFARTTLLLLHHLNALYPNNLLDFIRSESSRDPEFAKAVDPLVGVLRWNPAMIRYNSETELLVERWRGISPHHVLAEFLTQDSQKYWERLWNKASSPEQSLQRRQELIDVLSAEASDLDPLLSSAAADKIFKLQSLLEKSLLETSTMLTIPKEMEEATTKMARIPNDPLELQAHVLMLRNQLLFEKYLRQQHHSRLVAMQRNYVQSEQLAAECKALEAMLQAQQQEEKKLQKKLKAQQDWLVELKDQNRKLHQNFTMQLNQLRDKNKSLQEENYKVLNDYATRQLELSDLKQQLAQREDQLMRQQATIADLTDKLKEREAFQQRIISMREELIIWEEQHKNMKSLIKELHELKQKLVNREETITQLLSQLEEVKATNVALHARFGEALEQMAKLKAEARETKDHAVQLQDILEYQKLVAQARLQAVESKYNTLKQIVSGLERHVLDLNIELEKYRQLTKPTKSTTSSPEIEPDTWPFHRKSTNEG